jgi:hypothetical protein
MNEKIARAFLDEMKKIGAVIPAAIGVGKAALRVAPYVLPSIIGGGGGPRKPPKSITGGVGG